ncbi:MAG TPA: hypothetical protein VF221_10715, partial [Chloroflexota bacterium]
MTIRVRVSAIAFALSIVLVAGSTFWNTTSADSAVMGAQAPPPPPGKATPKPPAKKWQGPFAVVVVVDAARYDEFNLAQMPNLAKLAA